MPSGTQHIHGAHPTQLHPFHQRQPTEPIYLPPEILRTGVPLFQNQFQHQIPISNHPGRGDSFDFDDDDDDDVGVDCGGENSVLGDDGAVQRSRHRDARPEDWIWTDQQFEKLVMESSGLWPSLQHPYVAVQPEPDAGLTLLPNPKSLNSSEQKEMCKLIMISLRKRLENLKEEEMFESAMRKFTHRSTIDTASNSVNPNGNILLNAAGNASGDGEYEYGNENEHSIIGNRVDESVPSLEYGKAGAAFGAFGTFGTGIYDAMAEPFAAGMGEHPLSINAAKLLRADVKKTKEKEKNKVRGDGTRKRKAMSGDPETEANV